jgi:DNA repair exonuclease SbcCD nuclease subunit
MGQGKRQQGRSAVLMQETASRESMNNIIAECDKLSSEIGGRVDQLQQQIEPRPSGVRDEGPKLQPSQQGINATLREMRRKLRQSLEKISQLQEEFGGPR